MRSMLSAVAAVLLFAPAAATAPKQSDSDSVRFATFNLSLNRPAAGNLVQDLDLSLPERPAPAAFSRPVCREQARNNAEVIQRSDLFSRLSGVFTFNPFTPVGGFSTSDHRLVWVDVKSH